MYYVEDICWILVLQGSHGQGSQGKMFFVQGQGKVRDFWNWSGKSEK